MKKGNVILLSAVALVAGIAGTAAVMHHKENCGCNDADGATLVDSNNSSASWLPRWMAPVTRNEQVVANRPVSMYTSSSVETALNLGTW